MRPFDKFYDVKISENNNHLWITFIFTMVFFCWIAYNTNRSKFLPKCLSGKNIFKKIFLAIASLKKFFI